MLLFIFVIICLLAFFDYHRTVLAYASIRMFFHPGVCLKYDSPAIQLDFACCVLFFVLYFFHKKVHVPKQLKLAYSVLLLSYIAAIFASTFPLTQAIPPMMGRITLLTFSFIFLSNLDNIRDIRLFHNFLFISISIMIGYGMFEYVIQENPVIDYQKSMAPNGMEGMVYGDGHERLGSIRCQSLSAISISYGSYCIIWLCYALMHYSYYVRTYKQQTILVLTILCVIGAYSSGSKSPFIMLLSYIGLYLIMAKGHKLLKFLILSIIFIVFIVGGPFIYDFYMMIVDSSQSSTAGSDIPMRLMQFAATGNLLDSHSWLFGLGARGVMKAQLLNPAVLGAESIWLQIVLEQGLLGCLAYIIMMYSILRYGKKYMKRDRLIILRIYVISWIFLNTVTSLPGIDLSFFLCLCYAYIAKEKNDANNVTPSSTYRKERIIPTSKNTMYN